MKSRKTQSAMMMCLMTVCLCWSNIRAQSTDTLRKKELQGVTVKGAKPFIVMRADKIIMNVAESPVAAGSDALQVLAHAPGVADQGNGNYELRGKRVTVLVDGKDSRLSGEELKEWLGSLPAGSIDRIELMGTPPARYDAKGMAIINIITAKNRNFGTNGTLSLGPGAGQYTRYVADLGLNYRNARLNVYGNYDYQYNKQYYQLRSSRILDAHTRIAEDTRETRERNNHSFKVGTDYTINTHSSAGIMLKGLLNYRYRKVFTTSVRDYASEPSDSFSTVATGGDLQIFNPFVNVYYKTDFDTSGRQLTLNADYFNYDKTWNDNYVTNFYDPKGMMLETPYLLRDNSPANNTITSMAADYTQPLWKGKLEAGLKTTFTTTDNDIRWEQQTGGVWVTDAGKTNHFIYRENIYAAYASYSRSIKKFDLQAGLRAEETHMEGVSVTLDQTNTRSQFNLFPTVGITYNQSARHQFGIAYRKSIERFSFNIVNPFVTYVSQYFYYQGNPNIRPSIGNGVELSYTYNNELFSTLSYQHYNQVLTDIYRQDTGNVVISTYVNLRSAYAMNASITHAKAFLDNHWVSTNTVMATYAKYNEKGGEQLTNAGIGVYINTSNTFTLPEGLAAEISATYTSPMAYGVYKMKSRYFVDAGISKSILHSAGKLTLNVSDIFNSLTTKYDVASFGVMSSYNNKIESRFVRLVFLYKFGNQHVKAASNRKTGIEKEQRRMEGN